MDNNLQAPNTQSFTDSEQFRNGVRTVSLVCGIFRHDRCSGECFCTCHLSQEVKVRGARPNIVTLAFELRGIAKSFPAYWTDEDIYYELFAIVSRASTSRFGYGNDPGFIPVEMFEWTPEKAFEWIQPTLRRETSDFEATLADIFGRTPTREELEDAFGEDLRASYAQGLINIY